ncbi:MAG TPA: alpha/beta fold hydrolase [Planctomycetota bacterium]|nr:alpha/beta fold hydrolase [Planctomycetota bacterium]
MERIPHPAGGHLALDADRRAGDEVWVFVHGFGSDRSGAKATAIRTAAGTVGATFVAFDARGHGASSRAPEDLTLTGFLEDLDVVADAFGPRGKRLVLIGSSLGSLAVAWWSATRAGRSTANVLIAPAFGFMTRFLEEIGPERAAAWEREGVLRYRNEWLDTPLRHALVSDAARHDEARLARIYATDTRILHGLVDDRVPWQVSVEFAERCRHRPLDVVLLGGGDHRLGDRVDDLARWTLDFVADRRRAAPSPRA